MTNVRLIPRLDIKGPNLIKGIHLEGVRVIGDPNEFARKYYEEGADEILYIDAVASLYGRDNLVDIVRHTTQDVFIPITAGGGVRTIDDIKALLLAGADKVSINTAAVKNPDLIRKASEHYGSQCIVLSIEAKKTGDSQWEAYTDNGREKTGMNAVEWAVRGVELGAGEVLVTSIDQEGTKKGFDLELTRAVSSSVDVPVIASGGMGTVDHLVEVVSEGKADAVAMASVLHYKNLGIEDIRNTGRSNDLPLREVCL